MFSFFALCFNYFFIFWGFLSFVFIVLLNKKLNLENKVSNILFVKNGENQIEFYLRKYFFYRFFNSIYNQNLIIVDVNSSDETWLILSKLAEDYDFLSIYKYEDFKKNIDAIV